MECYVFSDQIVAQNALDYINNFGVFPIIGRNALTGKLEPNKKKTENWDALRTRATDGKYFFKRIPQEWIDRQSQDDVDYFLNTFNPNIEDYDQSWA